MSVPVPPSARWIQSDIVGSPVAMAPVPSFRKEFELFFLPKKAELTISALGLYEVEINGNRVSDHVLSPGWTDYTKRVRTDVFEVTDLLWQGRNAIGVLLADGWYCGRVAWKDRQIYGDRPSLLASLQIVGSGGEKQEIASDETWKNAPSAILASDLLNGEIHDARLEQNGWTLPNFAGENWRLSSIKMEVNDGPELWLSPAPPIRRIERLAGRMIRDGDACLFDFGQNLAGRVCLTMEAPRGTTVVIRHAEVLDARGDLFTDNLRSAQATDYYTCRGGGVETWEPRFTFHGFRFAEIGCTQRVPYRKAGLSVHSVEAIVLHSDTPETGNFACSSSLINRLQQNIVWSQKGNFIEIPTDCPQRDERLGWTGDAQIFVRTACFNMDVRGFFHKWCQDIRDAQRENGSIPAVIPDANFLGFESVEDGGAGWSDAAIICPWTIYLCYGDEEILSANYACMVRYLDFALRWRNPDVIDALASSDLRGGFGDWLALDNSGQREGGTPKSFIALAYLAHVAGLLEQIALILGHRDDAGRFAADHEDVKRKFVERYLGQNGLLKCSTQTAHVLALHFRLVPAQFRDGIAQQLDRMIRENDYHIGTGFLGTPYILCALEETGHLDTAYRLLEQETFPSWLFPVKNGATTIWERWDGWTEEKGFQDSAMNSFNHYAYGSVGEWLVRTVAGLEIDPSQPGYRRVIFKPRPGGSLSWAKASLLTPFGRTSIHWTKVNRNLHISLRIPEGTSGVFVPPAVDLPEREFAPGQHEFILDAVSASNW